MLKSLSMHGSEMLFKNWHILCCKVGMRSWSLASYPECLASFCLMAAMAQVNFRDVGEDSGHQYVHPNVWGLDSLGHLWLNDRLRSLHYGRSQDLSVHPGLWLFRRLVQSCEGGAT